MHRHQRVEVGVPVERRHRRRRAAARASARGSRRSPALVVYSSAHCTPRRRVLLGLLIVVAANAESANAGDVGRRRRLRLPIRYSSTRSPAIAGGARAGAGGGGGADGGRGGARAADAHHALVAVRAHQVAPELDLELGAPLVALLGRRSRRRGRPAARVARRGSTATRGRRSWPVEKWKDDTQTCDAARASSRAPPSSGRRAPNRLSGRIRCRRRGRRRARASFIGPALGRTCWKTRRRPPLCSKQLAGRRSAAPSAASGFASA